MRIVGENVAPILVPVARQTLVRIGTAVLIASYALNVTPTGYGDRVAQFEAEGSTASSPGADSGERLSLVWIGHAVFDLRYNAMRDHQP